MFQINKSQFPIKAHYFFFLAAMGPLLPFFPLIGKQLGLSEVALGAMSSVFPLLYLFVKPAFGVVADYFYRWRKAFFILLVVLTCVSFDALSLIQYSVSYQCDSFENCHTNVSLLEFDKCDLVCGNYSYTVLKHIDGVCHNVSTSECLPLHTDCILNCAHLDFHRSAKFWVYIILASLGNIFFNITNFISDAICFDILGKDNDKKYGKQRVWGTIGFGITALISGFLIDFISKDSPQKDYTPAFVVATVCMMFDLYFCTRLKLPQLSKSENIIRDVFSVIKKPRISVFLIFATFVGIVDSSVIYFLLWYVEDLANSSGMTENIKLLQGLTIAAETLIGETIAFFLSERILSKLGYAHCLSLGFLFYSLRLILVGSINDPWMILPIESVMQGPTYALLYTTIVAYASAITPPGTSATVQGLVAGMDDGLGYSLGCLTGGLLYRTYGGRTLFLSYGIVAFFCGILHFILHMVFFRKATTPNEGIPPAYHLANTEVELKVLN